MMNRFFQTLAIAIFFLVTAESDLVANQQTSFKREGVDITTDKYGQWWIETNPVMDSVSVETIQKILKPYLENHKKTAFFVRTPHSAFETQLKAIGFELYAANTNYKEWMLKNNSPIPEWGFADSGARGLIIHNGKVLLIKDRWRPNFYEAPGGALERGEFAEDGAIREVYEEVGLDTESVQLICNWQEVMETRHGRITDHGYYYLVKLKDETKTLPRIDPNEILEAKWVALDDVDKFPLSPYLKPVLDHIRGKTTNHKIVIEQPNAQVFLFPLISKSCSAIAQKSKSIM